MKPVVVNGRLVARIESETVTLARQIQDNDFRPISNQ